ncbi:MAG TPA: hypothetical protein VI434_02340 [Candidatus Dormibacteraeota bacterium]
MNTCTSIRLAGLLPLALTGILVTACGATSTSTRGSGSGSQPASGGSGSGSSSGNGVLDGIGHPVSICSLLPVTTVASVSGEPLTVAQEQDTLSYKIYSCDYTSADGTSGLTVSVLAMDAAAGFQGDIDANKALSGATPYQPISGLGDKAFSSISGVEALFGNVSVTVSDLQSTSASETLIRDLQPKL